ncbi:NAD(P)H-hydrate epimerase, partial [Ruthenibacterium lactatiformans]|nr:NAD(P)H-hydrate epimerase [Ruthenibacterium lactatiformans]
MNEVTTAQMKELERLADAAGLPYPRMMENAGAAAARELMARVPGLKAAAVFCG